MKRFHISSQQMAQEMKRRIPYRIHRVKPGERHSLQFPALPTLPELVETGRLEVLCFSIPQAKVQLERYGNVRVEDVAAPLPPGFADHCGQMIDAAVRGAEGLIAKLLHEIQRTQQLAARQKHIDVILRTPTGVVNEAGAMRETF